MEVNEDGSFCAIYRFNIRVAEINAKNSDREVSWLFNRTVETFDIIEAMIYDKNGVSSKVIPEVVTLIPGDIRAYPMRAELRNVRIDLSQAEDDDVLFLAIKRERRVPLISREFSCRCFPGGSAPDDYLEVRLRVPSYMPIRFRFNAGEMAKAETAKDTRLIWRAHGRAPVPGDVTAPDLRIRQLFVSSFETWESLATALVKSVCTDVAISTAILNLSEDIVRGAPSRREIACRIYDWISRNISVAKCSIGELNPINRRAAGILSAREGDFVGHAILFCAMLRCVGIEADIALVAPFRPDELGAIPVQSALTHAIVWLPEFNIYADTTSLCPFGSLPLALQGVTAFRCVSTGVQTSRISHNNEGAGTSTSHLFLKIAQNGLLSGRVKLQASGVLGAELRRHQLDLISKPEQGKEFQTAAKALLFEKSECSYEGSFGLGHIGLGAESFVKLGQKRTVLARPGDSLAGSLWNRDEVSQILFEGQQTEAFLLDVGSGWEISEVPPGMSVSYSGLSYTASWAVTGSHVIVKREFINTRKSRYIAESDISPLAQLHDLIRRDYSKAITLRPRDGQGALKNIVIT